MPPPPDIVPEDSWVLDVQSTDDDLILVVEAALGKTHPNFYWPPVPGEQHAYATIYVRLEGEVEWRRGPLRKKATDATGETDYGDLGSWWTAEDGTEHIQGEWGEVVVRHPRQSVEVVTARM